MEFFSIDSLSGAYAFLLPDAPAEFHWQGHEGHSFAAAMASEPVQAEHAELLAEKVLRQLYFEDRTLRKRLAATGNRKINWRGCDDCEALGDWRGVLTDEAYVAAVTRVRCDVREDKDADEYYIRVLGLETEVEARATVTMTVYKDGLKLESLSLDFGTSGIVDVGKSDDNDIVALHPSVSRHHCQILAVKAGGVLLVDLGSANGTYVDGQRCHPYRPEALSSGQSFSLGSSTRKYTMSIDSRPAERYYRDKERRLVTEISHARHAARMGDDKGVFGQDSRHVVLENLPFKWTRADLIDFLAPVDQPEAIHIRQSSGEVDTTNFLDIKVEKGVALVVFSTPEKAENAVFKLHGSAAASRIVRARLEPEEWTSGVRLWDPNSRRSPRRPRSPRRSRSRSR